MKKTLSARWTVSAVLIGLSFGVVPGHLQAQEAMQPRFSRSQSRGTITVRGGAGPIANPLLYPGLYPGTQAERDRLFLLYSIQQGRAAHARVREEQAAQRSVPVTNANEPLATRFQNRPGGPSVSSYFGRKSPTPRFPEALPSQPTTQYFNRFSRHFGLRPR